MNEIENSNIEQLTSEIVLLKHQTAQNIIEIGKRLIKAKEQLPHGEWGKWLEEKVDFKERTAQRFMQVANSFPNTSALTGLNQTKVFALLDVPKEEREEFIEQNPIDDMTTRQLQQAIKEKKHLEQQLEEERNKPPQIKEVVKEKRVIPSDYEQTKRRLKDLEETKSEYDSKIRRLEEDKGLLQRKVKLNEKEATEFKTLKESIAKLKQEKASVSRQIESATELAGLVVRIDHILSKELAPVKYSRAIDECKHDPVVVRNLTEIIERVNRWTMEMENLLPKQYKNIVEVDSYE